MVGAIILTFIITSLTSMVLFLLHERKTKDTEKAHILRENDGLKRQISEYNARDQRRREAHAYDHGLYDGRATDALYRQCLRKYMTREQPEVMMNGESEGT